MTVDKELLLKPRLPEDQVEIPGLGTVRVRGLSHAEAVRIGKSVKSEADARKRTEQLERKMLAAALVDPVLTEDEARQWQECSPAAEIERVMAKVQELSGTAEGADREAYEEFEQDSDAEFRLPAG